MLMRILLVLSCLWQHTVQERLFTLSHKVSASRVKPCSDPDKLSCKVVRLQTGVLRKLIEEDEPMDLPMCKRLKKRSLISEPTSRMSIGTEIESIELLNARGCSVVLSYTKDSVIGLVSLPRTPERNFVLEPCRNFAGCHVWKEMNSTGMVELDDTLEDDVQPLQSSVQHQSKLKSSTGLSPDELREKGIKNRRTLVKVSIKLYYTIELEKTTDNIPLFMNELVATANLGFIKSKVPVRLSILCIQRLDEIDDVYDMSAVKTAKAFKKFQSVADTRDGADLAALIVINLSSCGVAYIDSWKSGTTLSVSKKGCLSKFTFGHEVAHNFGAGHDRDNSQKERYGYDHGNYFKTYRTIMSYEKTGFEKRVNIFSSSVAKYEGIRTGDKNSDNARVIRENRFALAAIGNEETKSCIATSGLCHERYVIYEGDSFTVRKHRRLRSERRCRTKCEKLSYCHNWTFVKKGRRCTLRSTLTGKKFGARWVSSGTPSLC